MWCPNEPHGLWKSWGDNRICYLTLPRFNPDDRDCKYLSLSFRLSFNSLKMDQFFSLSFFSFYLSSLSSIFILSLSLSFFSSVYPGFQSISSTPINSWLFFSLKTTTKKKHQQKNKFKSLFLNFPPLNS